MSGDRPSVLVTGGAKRIGAAISKAFGEADWHVVIHYNSSSDEAEALAASLESAETVRADLCDTDALTVLVDDLAGRLPDWRALVNSASVFDPDDVTGLDVATNRKAMQVNALAPALLAQSYLAQAKARSGRRVIHVTDQKLANPNPDFFSYTMSKHALDATVAMLSMGAADSADRVYGLAPGAILPSHDQDEAEAEISHKMNLLGRRTTAGEVADAALFLASGQLASGQTLYCDSGQHLLRQERDVIYLARGEETA
ncbi:SDR family oxidoreductase [Qipengyuania sphaerica]|uniref:SDR family oxidoreductase n=1 Tax=Qipengyuania sphaerica TaxID=2867243 RepID=UPI001FFD71C1|nr:SDR family oxidoreductase [Qipengyuania sphaerica]